MLPNFLVIGGRRCATGWISRCLREHPAIFMAADETSFFAREYEKGVAWWQETYFTNWAGESLIGEKSATYLYYPAAPHRIAETLGDNIKLICCLRHPVNRLVSGYIYDNPQADASDFDMLEADSIYVQRSLYWPALERYLEHFPAENMLIMFFEDKAADPLAFMQVIYRHLGLTETFQPPSLNVQTKVGVFELQNSVLRQLGPYLLSPKIPRQIRLLYSNIRPFSGGINLSSESCARLLSFFSADITILEEYLGRDLTEWKECS